MEVVDITEKITSIERGDRDKEIYRVLINCNDLFRKKFLNYIAAQQFKT
ncbi:hypothetical protein A2U01_0036198, partial [Trifolium medium]|nr:hypothetical protein [Trifolium medium]